MLTDLADRQKSAHCGLHAGALGMVPRNVIEGFAGLQLEGDKPVAIPQLPAAWKSVTFRFSFAGKRYQCRVEAARNGQTVEPEPEES
jgi:trehalose/maltose hydrolase-like predicted phosphorylase